MKSSFYCFFDLKVISISSISIKSTTTKPPRSLNLSCRAISLAASKLVFRAVFSIFLSDVFLPEFTSIATSASVVLITIDPPDSNLTLKLNKSFI